MGQRQFEKQFIHQCRQLKITNTVAVAVSTGVDSMVLLHLLLKYQQALHISRLVVVYFDHDLRAQSAQETAFIKDFCQQRQLPLIWEKWRTPKLAEAAARNARYAFFERAVTQSQADWLVLAHHADDQMETILQKFVRGGRLSQLSGMKQVRAFAAECKLGRPLLFAEKKTLRNYAAKQHIRYFEDETNHHDDYWRNVLRHHIIPPLKAHNPKLNQAAANFASQINATQALASEYAAKLMAAARNDDGTYQRPKMQALAAARLQYCLEVILRKKTTQLSNSAIIQSAQLILGKKTAGKVKINDDLWLVVSGNRVFLRQTATNLPQLLTTTYYPRLSLGLNRFKHLIVDVQTAKASFQPCSANQFIVAAPLEKLRLRTRMPGDALIMPYGHKQVKKILREQKIPPKKRRQCLVLADDCSRNVWAILKIKHCDLKGRRLNAKIHYIVTYWTKD